MPPRQLWVAPRVKFRSYKLMRGMRKLILIGTAVDLVSVLVWLWSMELIGISFM